MTRKVYIFPILLFVIGFSFGAQDKIDSLQIDATNALITVDRIDAYFKLGQDLTFTEPDKALQYIQKALEMALSIGYDSGACEAYTSLAYIHRIQSQWDKAIDLYTTGLRLGEKINYKKGLIDAYTGLGNVYNAQGNWSEALKEHQHAYEIAEEKQDAYHMASALNNMGNTYLEISEYKKALEFYLRGLELWSKNERVTLITLVNISQVHFRLKNHQTALNYIQQAMDSSEIIQAIDILALCHKNKGMYHRVQGQYDSALLSYSIALETYKRIGNQKAIAGVTTNIGNIYFEKQDYNRAIEKYNESLAIQQEIGAKSSQSYTLAALGMAYKDLGDFARSEVYLLGARNLAKEVNVPVIVMDASGSLSELYAQQQRFEEAYLEHLLFKTINDSLVNISKSRQIAEMEAKYESAQKEKEIELLNATNTVNKLKIANRENQRNFLVIVLGAVLSLAIVIYSRYKVKSRANRKLKELDAFKTNFVTNISHEFRTPLTLILGPLERLIQDEPDRSRITQFQDMQQHATRVLDLINQLLDLSKIDAGSLTLRISRGDINNYIASLVNSFSSLAEQGKINFTIEVPDTERVAFFDRDKVQKIIYNLLSNAFKFTPENGHISVVVKSSHKMLTLKVIDTGCGFGPEMKHKIFERFQQLDGHVQLGYQGTGVGLALTKELVELHQGTIEVISEEDQGSQFTVYIPLEKSAYQNNEIDMDQPDFIQPSPKSNQLVDYESTSPDVTDSKPMVLIVEDNMQVRNFIRSIMEHDFSLIVASDGNKGFQLAKDRIPDLILSDLMMPGMDGMQFCEKIRHDECTSHIPIIMLTAKADLESRLEGLKTGVDDYLTKPFHSDELLIRIGNLITQRKKLREHYRTSIVLEPQEISVTPPDAVFLTKAIEIVEEHIQDNDFSVEKFQREIGMSRMQLHRKLKALTDCSASEFIRDQRLKRAAQILRTAGISVSEAAYQAGFNNLSYFAKCFKEKFGISPSEFHTTNPGN